MDSNEDEIHLFLRVRSDVHTAEQLETKIGLPADRKWTIGDFRRQTTLREKDHGVDYKSGRPLASSYEEHFSALLARLDPYSMAIRELSKSCTVRLWCAYYTTDYNPVVCLEPAQIEAIHHLGAALDIDIYRLPPATDYE